MHDNARSDDGRDLQPGQVCLIEWDAAGTPSALQSGAIMAADVVLYDRVLALAIPDLLPPGRYAEPLPAEIGEDAPAIAARALALACEGWSVVQLVRPCRFWRRRLRGAAEASGWPGGTGPIALRLIARTAEPSGSREVRLEDLPELVDGSAEEGLLTLIVGPLAARASAPARAFTANGLAG